MLYNPLLQLFLKSCAACSVYEMWKEYGERGALLFFFFFPVEPYMNLTVHYGDLTMGCIKGLNFFPSYIVMKAFLIVEARHIL